MKLITLNIVVDDAHSEALATHIVRSITDTDLCGIGDYVRRIGAELTDHGVLVTEHVGRPQVFVLGHRN